VEFNGRNSLTVIVVVAASQSSGFRGLVQSSQSLTAIVGTGPNREASRWEASVWRTRLAARRLGRRIDPEACNNLRFYLKGAICLTAIAPLTFSGATGSPTSVNPENGFFGNWDPAHIHFGNPCQLNRSMQHHRISWSDNACSTEPICKAVLNQNLNRAVFRLDQCTWTNLAP